MNARELVHHIRYNRWASRRLWEAAASLSAEEQSRALGASYASVRGTLNHIYMADLIWWDRLAGKPFEQLSDYEPPAEWDAFDREWSGLQDRYIAWAEALEETGWDRVACYRDIKGNPHQTPVRQIILHLINHDSYHRGQVATLLRQLGRTPPATDLIAYYREVLS